ncbi:MAG: prolyl oligopeptidase family serine peptidase [Proteobacteria bacterium]|nr:prolyl oligopeptidase family serine peptidase [Pseudomonadota bacterium]
MIRLVLLLMLSSACFAESDPFLWLEDIDSEESMQWVLAQNKNTADQYKSNPLYQELYDQALTALDGKSRIPSVSQRGKWLYNYWKDEKNPRGIYRRTSLKEFSKTNPKWQTILDMDKYNAENEGKWSFKGMNCFKPKYQRCLVSLSPGGGDSTLMKEFDMKKMDFIKGGFSLPNSKMNVTWRDRDHLFVATDFGDDSMTDSGYPRTVKLWRRGSDLSQAKILITADKTAISVFAFQMGEAAQAKNYLVVGTTFWTTTEYQILNDVVVELALPETATINGEFKGRLIVSLKEDWHFQGQKLTQGSVLLINSDLLNGTRNIAEAGDWEVFFKPENKVSVESISTSDESIILTLLQDVVSYVYVYENTKTGGWKKSQVNFPGNGTISINTVDDKTGSFFADYESFIIPPTLYHIDGNSLKIRAVKSQTSSFNSEPYKVEQYFARSADGTFVPYFVVMNKNTKFDGNNPTHIFSYGGFRVSLKPSYSGSYEPLEGAYGKLWLDRGGVFVSANIRGGGAYGPAWHKAALLKNRHKAFEDFEAVAEDLISRKITRAENLSIEGRSNGGLLVGATMTRRPDLYGAAIIGVPLLDMKRYNKLLAGASWVDEFGNPDDPDMWEYIKTYSPYQNLKKDTKYPKTFFFTSTRDDRVHPGHARKMAAKMQSYGYPIWYYENTEGGHGGSSTNAQMAERLTLVYMHLWSRFEH